MDKNKKFFLAYVPVIHRKYLELSYAFQGSMGVLGPKLLQAFPHLEREVRALGPEQAAELLGCMVVDEEKIPDLLREVKSAGLQLVMPDEDVSRGVAEAYFSEIAVEFVPIWLRWDRKNALSDQEPQPDLVISHDAWVCELVSKARVQALRNSSDWWRQVGALIIFDHGEEWVAWNHHLPSDWSPDINGDPRFNFSWGEAIECSTAIHAEAALVARAAKRGKSLDGVTVYVSTFPCPNCARLLGEAGVSTVVFEEGYSRADAWDILKKFKVNVVRVMPPVSV